MRSRQGERRFDALDGARALAFLAVLALHCDQVAIARFPDSAYGTSAWRDDLTGIWKAPLRSMVSCGSFFLGVFLVVSGFLSTFVLFLRSGPMLQQQSTSERGRILAFSSISANFIVGRFLRVWPVLMAGMSTTYLWAKLVILILNLLIISPFYSLSFDTLSPTPCNHHIKIHL